MGKPLEIKSIFDGMKGVRLNKLMTACFVIPSWRSIVGDRIAKHCKPVSFENGMLVLECDSSIWCAQISDHTSMILERICEVAGAGIVTGLNPVVARRSMTKISSPNTIDKPNTEGISQERFAWAESVADTVPKDVREPFLKAMLVMMAQNKKRREK